MKILFTLLFALICASSVAAQTPAAAPAGTGKIGVVNPGLFNDAKAGAGITRLKAALKAVADATKPAADRAQNDLSKYRTLAAEIDRLRKATGTAPAILQAKIIEAQDLETSLKRQEEDSKKNYEKVYSERVTPIMNDIFRAMNEYAKAKGYAIILNGPKLEQDDLLIGYDDRYDVTADFITFFNARPVPR